MNIGAGPWPPDLVVPAQSKSGSDVTRMRDSDVPLGSGAAWRALAHPFICRAQPGLQGRGPGAGGRGPGGGGPAGAQTEGMVNLCKARCLAAGGACLRRRVFGDAGDRVPR